jgi:hypothetical protein
MYVYIEEERRRKNKVKGIRKRERGSIFSSRKKNQTTKLHDIICI